MRRTLLLVGLLFPSLSYGQLGGSKAFSFLTLAPNPKVSAVGGRTVTLPGADPAFAWHNPALARDTTERVLSASSGLYGAGISFFNGSYALGIKDFTLHAGIHAITYGEFDGTDIYGNTTTPFSASEFALYGGIARGYGNFLFGANLKLLYSQIAGLTASGIAVDFGMLYSAPNRDLSIGLVVRNAGTQFNTYDASVTTDELPLEIETGITYRLPKSPFRLSLTVSNLETWVLYTNDAEAEKAAFGENLARRLTAGLEILAGKSLTLRAGYNHQRKLDLQSSEQNFGFAGFSVGFGLQLPRFGFDFAQSGQGATNGITNLGLTYRLK